MSAAVNSKLIILLGHISSGKTSVLKVLKERSRMGMSIDRLWDEGVSHNYKKLFRVLEKWALDHPTGVIETTGTSPLTTDLLHRLDGFHIPYQVFNLRCSLQEFERRERIREDRDAVQDTKAWYRPIYGLKDAISLNSTLESPEEIADRIEECLTQ